MKVIRKGKEPKSLQQYRSEPKGTNYDSFPQKQELREALTKEQGYICCYCMGRIRPDDKHMKIEHWASQDEHPELQLDYRNMLGACLGNMGAPMDEQHCDTYKASSKIKLNPTNARSGWERSIHYSHADGKIFSSNTELNKMLEKGDPEHGGLNLNAEILRAARLAAWKGVQEGISRKHAGHWTRSLIQDYIDLYGNLDGQGHYHEYCAAIVYFLRKRLAREK